MSDEREFFLHNTGTEVDGGGQGGGEETGRLRSITRAAFANLLRLFRNVK